MNRPARLVTAALAASAALLLTACGGGSDDSSSDDIKGADTGSGSPSVSTSASPTATAAPGAPDVSVPKGVNLVFDFDAPSDTKHAAALAGAENYIRALNHGIVKQDPNDPAYQYYSGNQAAQYAKSQIQAWVKGGWIPTGTDRFHNSDVTTLSGGKRVLVAFCENQAKFYSKEIKTGKILYTEENLDSYLKYSLLMVAPSGSSQVWKAQVVEVKGKVEECR